MSLNSLGFGVVFTAADLASTTIHRIAKGFAQLDTSIEKVAVGMIGFGLGGLAASLAFANSASDLDYRLAEVGTTTRATSGDVADLSLVARKFAAEGVASATDVVEAFRLLEKGGLSAAAAMTALAPTLDLVAASFGRLSSDQAAGLVAHLLGTFPELGGNATKAADALTSAVKATGIGFEDLGMALRAIEKGAAVSGASLGDTLAALGAIRSRVPDIRAGVSGISEVMERLAQSKTSVALGGFAQIVDVTTGRVRPLLDVVGELAANVQGLTRDQRALKIEQAFGSRGLQVLNPLIDEMTKRASAAGHGTLDFAAAIREMRKETEAVPGATAAAAAVQRATWTGTLDRIGRSIGEIRQEIGDAFQGVLLPVLQAAATGIKALASFIVALPPGLKKAFAGFAVLASVASLLIGLKLSWMLFGTTIVAVMGAVLSALWPAIASIAVVTAGAALLYEAWTHNFAGIRDFVEPILDGISLAVRSLFALFTEGEISGPLAEELTKAQNGPVLDFVEGVSKMVATLRSAWEDLGPVIGKAMSNVRTYVEPVVAFMFSAFAGLAKVVGGAFEALVGLLAGDFDTIAKGVAVMVNQGLKVINFMIDQAANVLELLGQNAAAASWRQNKVADFKPSQVASALGADDATVVRLGAQEQGGPRLPTAPGTVAPGGIPGGPPSSGIPGSAPLATPGGALTPEQIRALVEQAVRAGAETERSRPVVVEGNVILDGQKVGSMSAAADRERAGRSGQLATSRGG